MVTLRYLPVWLPDDFYLYVYLKMTTCTSVVANNLYLSRLPGILYVLPDDLHLLCYLISTGYL